MEKQCSLSGNSNTSKWYNVQCNIFLKSHDICSDLYRSQLMIFALYLFCTLKDGCNENFVTFQCLFMVIAVYIQHALFPRNFYRSLLHV